MKGKLITMNKATCKITLTYFQVQKKERKVNKKITYIFQFNKLGHMQKLLFSG